MVDESSVVGRRVALAPSERNFSPSNYCDMAKQVWWAPLHHEASDGGRAKIIITINVCM